MCWGMPGSNRYGCPPGWLPGYRWAAASIPTRRWDNPDALVRPIRHVRAFVSLVGKVTDAPPGHQIVDIVDLLPEQAGLCVESSFGQVRQLGVGGGVAVERRFPRKERQFTRLRKSRVRETREGVDHQPSMAMVSPSVCNSNVREV